jgi:uncharacterized protein (DUF362 family)
VATFRCNRRNFLKLTGAAAAAAALPACSDSMRALEKEANAMPVIDALHSRASGAWIAKDAGEAEAYPLFKQVVEAATDFSWLSRGDAVFVKIAINSANPYPATTDRWSVASTIRLLKEKGAGKIIVGDSSGVESVRWTREKQRGVSRECCEKAGLLKVINEQGAEAVFFEEQGYDAFIPVSPAGPHHWKESLWISKTVESADHMVYLPRIGSHVLADISSGMKIGVGFLREDSRCVFHSGGDQFYAMYEEINHVPAIADRLRLVVSSGRKVLATFGPDNGHVTAPAFGPVIASEDLLAHEMAAYAWLCYNREFETSFFDVGITGRLTKRRSFINRAFVWHIWEDAGFFSTPGIPLYIPGNLYAHPSILNATRRLGGRPSHVDFEAVNAPGESAEMAAYIQRRMADG